MRNLQPKPMVAIFFWLIASVALAQPDLATHLQFRRFSPRDGLPGGAVHAVLQDSRGFMWFGTYDGVSDLRQSRRLVNCEPLKAD